MLRPEDGMGGAGGAGWVEVGAVTGASPGAACLVTEWVTVGINGKLNCVAAINLRVRDLGTGSF